MTAWESAMSLPIGDDCHIVPGTVAVVHSALAYTMW